MRGVQSRSGRWWIHTGIAFVSSNSVNPFFKLSKARLKRLGDLAETLHTDTLRISGNGNEESIHQRKQSLALTAHGASSRTLGQGFGEETPVSHWPEVDLEGSGSWVGDVDWEGA